MRVLAVASALLLAGCAIVPPPAHAPDDARREVIAVADALFAAMQSRDIAAIRGLFVPGTEIVSIRSGAPSAQPRRQTVSEFAASVAASREELRERMRGPRVEMDGDVAALWTAYDFHLDGRFSHCGHDAFHFVRLDGAWMIVALTYTVQTTGCPAESRS